MLLTDQGNAICLAVSPRRISLDPTPARNVLTSPKNLKAGPPDTVHRLGIIAQAY